MTVITSKKTKKQKPRITKKQLKELRKQSKIDAGFTRVAASKFGL